MAGRRIVVYATVLDTYTTRFLPAFRLANTV